MNTLRKYWWHIFLFCVACAVCKIAFELVQVLILEGKGAIDGDGLIFTVMGRAMLNGVIPYVDLFETKPPGVFLIMALSLLFTGGERLASLMQVSGFVFMAAIPAVVYWKQSTKQNSNAIARYALAGICLLIGMLITLYAEERSGTLFAEAFGSIFGVLYIGILALQYEKEHVSRKIQLLYAIALLCSIGTKEPFAAITFGSSILLARNLRDWVQVFLIPVCMAIALGLILLLVLGLFDPYFFTYLPVTLLERTDAGHPVPLYARGMEYPIIPTNLIRFYTEPLTGVLIVVLWWLYPLLRTSWSWLNGLILSVAYVSLAYFYEAFTRVLVFYSTEHTIVHAGNVVTESFAITQLLIFTSTFVATLFVLRKRSNVLLMNFIAGAIALYCMNLAVGAGAYYNNNHYAFPVPVFITLAIVFAMYLARSSKHVVPVTLIAGLALLAGFRYTTNEDHIKRLHSQIQLNSVHTKERTEKLDGLLDACKLERYAAIWSFRDFAFAKHTPYGPMNLEMNFLPEAHWLYITTYKTIADHAMVAILRKDNWNNHFMKEYIQSYFTLDAPYCATPYMPIEGYDVYFRKPATDGI